MTDVSKTDVVETTPEVVTKITSDKPVKIKDPKRVAQGKKLTEISKQAKERKMRERIEQETQEEGWYIPFGYVVGTVGLSLAAGALYYWYTPRFEYRASPVHVVESKPTSTKARFDGLETFD